MKVKLLTGPKAGKIADVTHDHGKALVEAGQAEEVLTGGEIWPEKEEKEESPPVVVVQPIIIEPKEEDKPKRRRKK